MSAVAWLDDLSHVQIARRYGATVTEDTGGGCVVAFIPRADGTVVGVYDECVAIYASLPVALGRVEADEDPETEWWDDRDELAVLLDRLVLGLRP